MDHFGRCEKAYSQIKSPWRSRTASIFKKNQVKEIPWNSRNFVLVHYKQNKQCSIKWTLSIKLASKIWMFSYKSESSRNSGVFVSNNVNILDCSESWKILRQRFLRYIWWQTADVDFTATRLFRFCYRFFRHITGKTKTMRLYPWTIIWHVATSVVAIKWINFFPTHSTLWLTPPTAAAAAAWSLAFLASISSDDSSGAGVFGNGGGGGGGTMTEDNGLLPDDVDPQFQSCQIIHFMLKTKSVKFKNSDHRFVYSFSLKTSHVDKSQTIPEIFLWSNYQIENFYKSFVS